MSHISSTQTRNAVVVNPMGCLLYEREERLKTLIKGYKEVLKPRHYSENRDHLGCAEASRCLAHDAWAICRDNALRGFVAIVCVVDTQGAARKGYMRTKFHGSEDYKVDDAVASWKVAFAALLDLLYSFHLYKPGMLAWSTVGIGYLDNALNNYYSVVSWQHAHPDHEYGRGRSRECCWFCQEAKDSYVEALKKSMRWEVDCLLKRVDSDTSGMWRNMTVRGRTTLKVEQEDVLKRIVAYRTFVRSDVYRQVYEPFLRALRPIAELATITEEDLRKENRQGAFYCKVRCLGRFLPDTVRSAISSARERVKIDRKLSEGDFKSWLATKVISTVYTPQEAGRVLAHAGILKVLEESPGPIGALASIEAELGIAPLRAH